MYKCTHIHISGSFVMSGSVADAPTLKPLSNMNILMPTYIFAKSFISVHWVIDLYDHC